MMPLLFALLLSLLQPMPPLQAHCAPLPATKPLEPFEVFFPKFQHNRHFQTQRTIFPLLHLQYDATAETIAEEGIDQKDWKALRFDKQGNFAPLGGEPIAQTLHLNNSTATLEIRGTNSCISEDYVFERQSGKWYLVAKKS